MKILVSAGGMLRMFVLCFALGVALGLYFGVAGPSEAVPPTVDHSVGDVDVTAP